MRGEWIILWTDALLYVLIFALLLLLFRARQRWHLRQALKAIITRPAGMVTFIILLCYLTVALLDSIHFRLSPQTENISNGQTIQQPVQSVLDLWLSSVSQTAEKTYSEPFATHLYNKQTLLNANHEVIHDYPRLDYGGKHLGDNTEHKFQDIAMKSVLGVGLGMLLALGCQTAILGAISLKRRQSFRESHTQIWTKQTELPWRSALITITILLILITTALTLAQYYHIFGTDKVGTDVFYESIKSIRTGLVIGTITTLVMLPFALFLGTVAGYFGGKIDDLIQYLYTTLSSIPGVLLIAAAILSLQVAISQHPEAFPTLIERADARLLALCVILGVTSWTGLCRVLRAETLKIRELDFVLAARSLGAGHFRIMRQHILPNTMHIVIISIILDFSGLVLAEAVLSYIGIGVDPTTSSWGNMINAARLEMAREPIVWWPLLSAFVFMFVLVLSANIFSDSVRDAFDPRVTN